MNKNWRFKNKETTLVSLGAFFLCFALNFLNHGQLFVAILNSLLLVLSIFFFQSFSGKKIFSITPVFLILLGVIPLFHFNPQQVFTNYLQLTTLGLWLFAIKIRNKKIKYLLFSAGILFIFWGSLTTGRLLNWSFDFDKERTIFHVPSFQNAIIRHRKEALYAPFQLRPLIFSSLVYFYNFLANIAHFLSLKNLYDVLLIANLYPLFWGLTSSLKSAKNKHGLIYLGLLVTLIVIGLNRVPDKFNSLYFSSPLLLYFILLGLEKINIKVYALLLFLSLIMIASPQV